MNRTRSRSSDPRGSILIDELEAAIDEVSIVLVRLITAHGYTFAVAWAALADARDLIVDRLVAEDARIARAAAAEASRRLRGVRADGR